MSTNPMIFLQMLHRYARRPVCNKGSPNPAAYFYWDILNLVIWGQSMVIIPPGAIPSHIIYVLFFYSAA